MRLAFLFILVCTIAIQPKAQQYNFLHYKVENGLSYNSVMSILQDSKGFMWFATKDGLNRYDGYKFKTFRNIPGDPQSLGVNATHKLIEDKSGNILVGTSRGLYLFDVHRETFTLTPGTEKGDVHGLQMDERGNIWYLLNGRIFCLDKHYEKLQQILPTHPHMATSISKSPNHQLWIGFSNGEIASVQSPANKFSFYSAVPATTIGGQQVECLLPINEHEVLIGTGADGLLLYNASNKKVRSLFRTNDDGSRIFVRECVAVNEHEYWIATELGIYIWNSENLQVTHLNKRMGDPYSLSDNAVYSLCKDLEGGIWAGTYFGGVNYMPRQFNNFEKFYPNGEPSISGNAVREILQDKYGRIWIGTEDAGLNMMDTATGKVVQFLANKQKEVLHTTMCMACWQMEINYG